MNEPVIALAVVALALVGIFVAVWLIDARRTKHEVTDGERLDVADRDA